jgi:hypothetical protein
LINLDKFCKDNTEDDIIIEMQRAAHHLCDQERPLKSNVSKEEPGVLRHLGEDTVVFEDDKGDATVVVKK